MKVVQSHQGRRYQGQPTGTTGFQIKIPIKYIILLYFFYDSFYLEASASLRNQRPELLEVLVKLQQDATVHFGLYNI